MWPPPRWVTVQLCGGWLDAPSMRSAQAGTAAGRRRSSRRTAPRSQRRRGIEPPSLQNRPVLIAVL
eukprot:13339246-Alexandrium_andersonii.AAC.1